MFSAIPMADAAVDATVAVAIVTGILAGATVALAVITHFGNRSARADAARQLKASHRPVIVPFQRSADGVTVRGGQIPTGTGPHITENPPDRPDLPTYSAAFIPVESVGTGPALNVQGTFQGPRGKGETGFPAEAIAPGARGVVAFESWTGESLGYTGNDESVSAVITYEDVFRRPYRTNVTFDIGHNAYRSTLVAPE